MGKKKVKQYTEEFKQSSAKLAVDSDKSTHQIAKELGIAQTTLQSWMKKYYLPIRLSHNLYFLNCF